MLQYKIIFGGCHDHDRMVVGFTTVQSVPITTKVVSLNPAQAKCTQYNIDWRQVSGFLLFPLPIKLTPMI